MINRNNSLLAPGSRVLGEGCGSFQRGFTLIELLIVVLIIAVIVSVAYPSYTDYVARGKRQAAKNTLYMIADRQELYFQDHKSYAAKLSAIGYDEDKLGLDSHGQLTSASDSDRTYVLELVGSGPNAYTVQATPQLQQAERDSKCGVLTLSHLGERGHSGTASHCW